MTQFFHPEPEQSQLSKVGVLLINLGTPELPTAEAVGVYLKEFLSDQRVVELPKWFWQIILRGVILPFRSKKSAHAYQAIWQHDGSPLFIYTQKQTQLLNQALNQSVRDSIIVDFAMTYGEPSVKNKLMEFKQQGVNRLLVIPLYPQYASSSTGAAFDKVWQQLLKMRNQIHVRTIKSYYDNEEYIRALSISVKQFWEKNGRAQKLLMSFHGIPQQHFDLGDPYPLECQKTAELLANSLSLTKDDYIVAYQSRFGKNKWIGPSTQELLLELPKKEIKSLDVICPGFSSDCLETLEEIAIQGKEDFLKAGGASYHYIPCLNEHPAWVSALTNMVRENISGWL